MKVAVDIEVRCEFLLEIGDDAVELVTGLRAVAGWASPAHTDCCYGSASLSSLKGITNGTTARAPSKRMVAKPCFRSPPMPDDEGSIVPCERPKMPDYPSFHCLSDFWLAVSTPFNNYYSGHRPGEGTLRAVCSCPSKSYSHILCSAPVSAVDRPIGSRYDARS